MEVEDCREWINSRPRGESVRIAEATGMSYTWVRHFARGIIKDVRSATLEKLVRYIRESDTADT